jgi:hypothetical protein
MNLGFLFSLEVAFPAVLLLIFSSLFLLLGRSWRWMVLILTVQYLGVFLLITVNWPLPMAAVKLIAGWMSAALLGLGMHYSPEMWREVYFSPSGRFFRLLAAGLVGMVLFSVVPQVNVLLPAVPQYNSWGSLVLVGMGLLQIGLSAQPFRVVVGLLSVLSGFEIVYASVESSALVAGMLAGVHLGLALAGAYLLMAPALEEPV